MCFHSEFNALITEFKVLSLPVKCRFHYARTYPLPITCVSMTWAAIFGTPIRAWRMLGSQALTFWLAWPAARIKPRLSQPWIHCKFIYIFILHNILHPYQLHIYQFLRKTAWVQTIVIGRAGPAMPTASKTPSIPLPNTIKVS